MVSWFGTGKIVKNLYNGNFKDAKALIQWGCKTKPETQAFRVGIVVAALVDPEGYYNRPDLAVILLKLFKP